MTQRYRGSVVACMLRANTGKRDTMNLGTATTLHDGNMVYHDTMICESLGNGKTRLNSGGWRTATTKKRMNQYAEMMGYGWRLFQREYNWFVSRNDLDTDTLEFSEGMIVE